MESGVNQLTHWYYQNKKKPLLKYIHKQINKNSNQLSVLDIGSGSGFFSYEIEKKYKNDLSGILLCDIGYSEGEIEEVKDQFVKKTALLPEKIENTVIIMMDLLEHIEHDEEFIKDLLSRCGENTYFFITVPAFKSIWSGHDVYLGHYRRHTIKTISKLLKDINIGKTYYIFMWLFPAAWLYRKLIKSDKDGAQSDMKPIPGFINAALRFFCSIEFLYNRWNKIFGLTCVLEGSK